MQGGFALFEVSGGIRTLIPDDAHMSESAAAKFNGRTLLNEATVTGGVSFVKDPPVKFLFMKVQPVCISVAECLAESVPRRRDGQTA